MQKCNKPKRRIKSLVFCFSKTKLTSKHFLHSILWFRVCVIPGEQGIITRGRARGQNQCKHVAESILKHRRNYATLK